MKEYRLRKRPTPEEVQELQEYLDSSALATVFWHRNLRTIKDIEGFTSVSNLLPVHELFDVKSFYERIRFHRENNSKIVIYGDYDADGAVAAAILFRFFSKVLKLNVTVYIPDRHEEGYGLNHQALETLAQQGTNLVITVDCGVRDAVLIKKIMSSTSMEVMVTDHHQPGMDFPECVTVHPLYPGHQSLNAHTSGGVVAWKVVRYLEERFNLTHTFSDSVVDLAGTSLVTDIMPLLGENRVILKRALHKMRQSPGIGIRVLAEIAQVPIAELSTYHLGYIIGPRLNASGRIGNQYTSTRLLSTDNEQKAREFALETHEINTKRQELTKKMLTEAEQLMIKVQDKLLIASSGGWDEGIIGLVAGKLMNSHNLPAIAISYDKEKGIAKGSARSFGSFDITQFLTKLANVLERFGGHQNAAGFTLLEKNIQQFVKEAENVLKNDFAEYVPLLELSVDTYVTAAELTEPFFQKLSLLEPFGQANATPLFAVEGVISQFSTFGQTGSHVRLELQTERGILKGLAFDALRLLPQLDQGKKITVIGKPKLDEYQGRKQISFFIEDIVERLEEAE